MIFQDPAWHILFVVIPGIVFIFFFARSFWKKILKRQEGGAALVLQLESSRLKRYLRLLLVLIGIFFMITALMRPRWGARDESETELGIDIAILLDVSRSMWVQDIKPSRLERTISELKSLVRELEGNRFSLVLFAGAAFIQCPLTVDIGAISEFLDSASPNLIGLQGTNIDDGLLKAARALKSQFKRNKIILLVSDGENHEESPLKTAFKLYSEDSIRIFTIGVGTSQGGEILTGDGIAQDIVSRLDEETLKEIARSAGGRYFHIDNERFDTAGLQSSINSIEKSGVLIQRPDTLQERYPVFLIFALCFFSVALLISERKSE